MPQTALGSYRELTKRIDDLRSELHRGFDAIKGDNTELRTEARPARHDNRV